jgi:beta-mannosidase
MSGSNWIPSSSEISTFSQYYEDNLYSAKLAGIKMLRVWGGGIYEQDLFYEIAAKYGILIWQDFMFACSTYPNNTEFLDSVSREVDTQEWIQNNTQTKTL